MNEQVYTIYSRTEPNLNYGQQVIIKEAIWYDLTTYERFKRKYALVAAIDEPGVIHRVLRTSLWNYAKGYNNGTESK